jgi:hypothetical protein
MRLVLFPVYFFKDTSGSDAGHTNRISQETGRAFPTGVNNTADQLTTGIIGVASFIGIYI